MNYDYQQDPNQQYQQDNQYGQNPSQQGNQYGQDPNQQNQQGGQSSISDLLSLVYEEATSHAARPAYHVDSGRGGQSPVANIQYLNPAFSRSCNSPGYITTLFMELPGGGYDVLLQIAHSVLE